MSNKSEEGFYRGVRHYMLLLVAASPLFALSKFVQGKLALDWRHWLTNHMLSSYFSDRAYYKLKMGAHVGAASAASTSSDALKAGSSLEEREKRGCIDSTASVVRDDAGPGEAAGSRRCLERVISDQAVWRLVGRGVRT